MSSNVTASVVAVAGVGAALFGLQSNLEDEIEVQGAGDPPKERDSADDAPGFETRKRGMSHASLASESDLRTADCETAAARHASRRRAHCQTPPSSTD
jgi:hypothetical protein